MSHNRPPLHPDPNPGVAHPAQILVVGSGGREHALARALAASPKVARVFVAPGNGGTDDGPDARIQNLAVDATDVPGLVLAAQENDVDLVLVGPEAPLSMGLCDALLAADIPVFGPRRVAAQLECSKAFAKQFMQRHGIPTAAAAVFDDLDEAKAWLAEHPGRVVVKASGLAAGKGVIMAEDSEQAAAALDRMMRDRIFGEAGETVLLEEWLEGEEVSVLAFCDGRTALPMPPAQDHKRAFEGDRGPNTGGMGAYAPAPCLDAEGLRRVHHEILLPVIRGMREEAYPYVGILYAGLMLTADGPRVLEFNCRFGDPETEALLALHDGDLYDVLDACVRGRLSTDDLRWKSGAAATVVLASAGYPGAYAKGQPISGIEDAEAEAGVTVDHAGTRRDADGRCLSAGGRVLAVTGYGDDLQDAIARAYRAADAIHFEGKHARRDIGARALGRTR
ncbi:MAG: phosphoribosylamine--glycine ligase [Pseudomonadota bacterium]|jgi:phosphoribosylamine--glycine ligase